MSDAAFFPSLIYAVFSLATVYCCLEKPASAQIAGLLEEDILKALSSVLKRSLKKSSLPWDEIAALREQQRVLVRLTSRRQSERTQFRLGSGPRDAAKAGEGALPGA